MRRHRGWPRLILVGFLLGLGALPSPAHPSPEQDAGLGLPAAIRDFDAQADRFEALSPDRFLLEGNVVFKTDDVLLQADRVIYNHDTRTGEAEGNVLFVQGAARTSGDKITFDLANDTAEITNATGFLEQGFLFRAERVIQLDKRRLRFEKGMFTACTQPVPYWSFKVRSGLIVQDRYVHLYSLRLNAGRVPVFYSPYLVFPIKPDRATGMLIPQIGFSDRLGTSVGNAFFWTMGRSQDATLYLDAFSEGSLGGGLEYRFLPSARGAGIFTGYIIREEGLSADEKGPENPRWNVRYNQQQIFRNGGQFLADFNLVSDADYFLDFSRDLDRGSDPTALSRAQYVINRGYTSLNIRGERREQFFADDRVKQTRLPETELRLRSRRLGSSPFFLAFEGSASSLQREAPDSPDDWYGRVDLLPTISAPMAPLPYLDITPTLKVRETFYTDSLDPNNPTEFAGSLSREFLQFDLQFLGPRFSRIFFDDAGNGRLKSTLEPRLVYRYQTSPDADKNDLTPRFDEIDVLPRDLNELEYGLFSRLLAKRLVNPRPPPAPLRRRGVEGLVQQGAGPWTGPGPTEPLEEAAPLDGSTPPGAEEQPEVTLSSPVEIASFSITQRYSFMTPLSEDLEFVDVGGTDELMVVDDSYFSPIRFAGRVNPAPGSIIDVSAFYDVIEQTFSLASVGAGLINPNRGFLNATWFFRNGLDGRTDDSSQIRFSGGTSFFRDKISTAVSLNYDATLSDLQDQRYRIGYDTQCCGVALEILNRDFVGTDTQEFRFVLNLRGIGNFLEIQGRGTGQ